VNVGFRSRRVVQQFGSRSRMELAFITVIQPHNCTVDYLDSIPSLCVLVDLFLKPLSLLASLDGFDLEDLPGH
jgi:hypothetical protein